MILYRIVRGQQFTIDDVQSNMARCKRRRTGELIDMQLWAGVSMFTTIERARHTAEVNDMGTLLARLDVPEDDQRIVLSRPNARGHVTVWACERLLYSCFREIVPIA